MRKLLIGLFLLIGITAEAQVWSGSQVQISQFGRLKRLIVKPTTPAATFGIWYNLWDSLHFETPTKDWNLGKILYQDSLGYYYLKTQTDSIVAKVMDTVHLYADSLAYYYLKPQTDSIGNKIMDTVWVYVDSINLLQDTALIHDTRLRNLEGKAQSQDIWQKDPDSTTSSKYPVNISSLAFPPDSRVVMGNLPNINAPYNDTLLIGYILSGEYIMNLFGISDGAKGISKYGVNLRGTLYADAVAGTGFQGIRDTLGNLQDSITKHKGWYFSLRDSVIAEMDSTTKHTGWYYSLQDSVINTMDSIIKHSGWYYSLRDSVRNSMDSIVNHTVRYYATLDSLNAHRTLIDNHTDSITKHSGWYYSLRDSVIAEIDSTIKHTGWYYSLRDSVRNNMDSISKHTGWYYSLRDSVVNSMDSIVNHTVRYYSLRDSIADHRTLLNALLDSIDTHRDTLTAYRERIEALENSTGAQDIWQKDSDSTTSAKYPVNLSSLRTPPDSRVVLANVPNVNAPYGDTLSIAAIINGALMQFYGVSDGARGVKDWGLKVNGYDVTDSITLLKDSLAKYRLITNHDSLITLDEKSYNSLDDKPTIPTVIPAALTKVDDTNVTLTLGGTPATSLLQGVSITAGWTGILGSARGGTGNGFTKFTGPTTAEKTFTLPNANATIARTDAGQTFTGVNTMSDSLLVPNDTYSTENWNNSSAAPSKNAIRDKIEAIAASKFIVQGTTNTHLPGAQFLGSLESGIVTNTKTSGILSTIPNLSSYWTEGYNDKINSASWSTSTGILTLNQQDFGTVAVDLDGRYLTTSSAYQPLFPNVVNDITLANQYGKTFQKSASEFSVVSGHASPHASLIIDDYYYILTRAFPSSLLRFDPDNLSGGGTVITFPTTSHYGEPEQMVYVQSKNKIYILFARFGSAAVIEVDPNTMAYSTVISLSSSSFVSGGPMISDGTYMYLLSNGSVAYNYADSLYQYQLSDFSQTKKIQIMATGTDYPHAITYDGNSLFIVGNSTSTPSLNKVYKVDLPSCTLSATSIPTYSIMSDDLAVTSNKLYVGKEDASGYILVIDKSGSPFTKDSIYTGISAECYGVFFDGMYIWATMAGTPGGLSRINPYNNEVSYMYFGTGWNNTNELSFHGGRMLLTFYHLSTSTFGVGRICLPNMIPIGAGGGMVNPMTTSQDMIVGGASGVPTRLPKGNDGDVLGITSGTVGWVASGGGGMVYPGAGIPISTGSAWSASITNNSAHWNTAYTHSTLTSGNPHGVTKADIGLSVVENTALSTWVGSTYLTTLGTLSSLSVNGTININPSDLQIYGNTGEGFIAGLENNVAIGVKDGGGDFEYVMKAAYNSGNSAFEANYNGSKVFETNADGVNIPTGKVYQVAGYKGVSNTYAYPTSITISGGIVTAVSAGSSNISDIRTYHYNLNYDELTDLNSEPISLTTLSGAGVIFSIKSIVVYTKIKDGNGYDGGSLSLYVATSTNPSDLVASVKIFETGISYPIKSGDSDQFILDGPCEKHYTNANAYIVAQSASNDSCPNDGSTVEIWITYELITL